MRRQLSSFLRRFRYSEKGQVAVEFVVMTPLLFTIFMTAIELGVYSKRQMWLDRGLDIAVRQVRLNTDSIPTHDALKQTICANAGFIPDCVQSLKLEMILVDPRAFAGLGPDVDCVDRSQPIASQEDPNYQQGSDHDLMIMRACIKFDPVFPTTGLGFDFPKDSAGQAAMTAMTAFVQEPGL
ncbi:TadE/TadG family type IV pilus assembly protein [Roseobacter weihaiensis]|uniref:TadE/TadG family type IV pilus assembly protein n=1 Tax=Roseobacter weihaiensis TaxID=2763262 RepID=UPI001D0B162F|nr:TadE family protein [Roseobacter sp. H9]